MGNFNKKNPQNYTDKLEIVNMSQPISRRHMMNSFCLTQICKGLLISFGNLKGLSLRFES